MKNSIKFISIYLVFIALIFSFYFNLNLTNQNKLTTTQSELDGIEYLKSINALSVSIALYLESIELKEDPKYSLTLKDSMLENIQETYRLQEIHPKFKSTVLNDELKKIEHSVYSNDDYNTILDLLNHENYRISDISELLFENDRKLYFLSSLATHYLPEYIISTLIVHRKVEAFYKMGTLSQRDKDLYTEQNKLMYLSSNELSEIIKLLHTYDDAAKLQSLIDEINSLLTSTQAQTGSLVKWEYNTQELENYITLSYQLLSLAYTINNENMHLLESNLKQRKETLNSKILINRFAFFFILLMSAILSFFTYRVYISNIEKDKEIIEINENLDKYVIFSTTDSHGHITHVSQALLELSGYTQDELVGKSHRLFRHPDMGDEIFKVMWETISSKKIWKGELKNRTKDNSFYWVKMIISPKLNAKGDIVGYQAYREDITDKKELEVEKLKTQMALDFKSMFLSNMSHEIRTPLNGIIGFTHLALETPLNQKQQDLISKVKSASQMLLGVINDILDISKIESGKMMIEKVPFNLQETIESIQGLLHQKAEEKGITLILEAHDIHHFDRIGDPLRLSQILTNLINNAIKFTSEGSVVLRLKESEDDRISFEVADTGIGLKPEDISTLFDEFTQADMSTSRKYGGTGLGLSICKQLVHLMGGEINVESTFGAGSTFSFTLSLEKSNQLVCIENTQEDIKSLEEEVNALHDVHILVAEDNKMNQILLTMLLENSQLSLDFANDGQIALDKYQERSYDLVLMDIQMPNMNGYEATQAIRAIDTNIPIIALSANVIQEDIQKCLDAGMNDHLAKPIDMQKLYRILLKYLNRQD